MRAPSGASRRRGIRADGSRRCSTRPETSRFAAARYPSTMSFPSGPDELDAAWLEDVLRVDGGLPHVRVPRLSAVRIGDAYGWDATIARVTLDADGAPPTIV